MRVLLGLLLAAFVTAAQAADNTVILTPGAGVTMRTKDVGSGVESPLQIPGDTSGNALATAPGTPNASFALPIQGVTGGTAVPISGTVTANAGTNLNTSLLALETGGNLATIAGSVSASVLQTNEKQVNGVTPLMGNGVTGTGSQRVTIASDNTAFSVNATVSQATSSSLKAQVDPLTAASWGIGTSTQNSATASNGQLALGQFNTTPTTITTGNMSPLQMDSAGNLLVNIKAGAGSGGTAIADNAAFTLGTTSETPIGCYNGSATTTAAHVGIVSCNASGQININNIAGTISLPTGAATSALQTTINTTLGTPMQNSGGSVTANAGTNLNTSALATHADVVTNSATSAHTCSTGGTSLQGCLGQIDDDVKGAIGSGTNLIGNTGEVYPAGSTPITASATGTTAATTATLAANATLHTYICGLSIRANATGAATGNATVTGTVTGTLNFTQWTAPLASGLGIVEQVFKPCIISSTTNTAIAVISAAPGSGGVVSVSAWGYQL